MRGQVLAYRGVEPKIAGDVFVALGAFVIGDVEIKEGSSIWFNTVVRGDVNYIRIGAYTNIQDLTMVHVTTEKYPTIIGDYVTIGHKAMIHGCVIEDHCLIGMSAVIMDGVKVGRYSIVAAGSLLPPGKEYPSGVLIKGVPAKVARELKEEEKRDIERLALHYHNLAKSYLK